MKLELLYFDGCSSWHQALENLRLALRNDGKNLEISLVRVKDTRHAMALRFVGSLTFRLQGKDRFPDLELKYGMSCRLYRTEEGIKGWPTVRMLYRRLRRLAPGASARHGDDSHWSNPIRAAGPVTR